MSENPHFDISAAVVRQLGEELVSDEVTALLELVKNAYDADATYANLIVDTNEYLEGAEYYFNRENKQVSSPGYIIIEDDGIGMGRKDIEQGWLKISFSPKRGMRARGELTPKRRRAPLGDKGLGRLSTQRLGQTLEMFTSPEELPNLVRQDSGTEYHIAFDWRDFSEETSLSEVPIHFGDHESPTPRKGTKLVITNLIQPQVWTDHRDRLIRQLSQLLFPFGEVRPFDVYVTINGVRIDLATIVEGLRDVAVSRFSFSFDKERKDSLVIRGRIGYGKLRGSDNYDQVIDRDNGQEFFNFLSSPKNGYRIPEAKFLGAGNWFISFEKIYDLRSIGDLAIDNRGVLAHPGPFSGEIDDFVFRGAGLELESLDSVFNRSAEYRELVQANVGVRIYRDGFGIRPYGLDGNDWLNLGTAQTSGRSWYGLRPSNVIGYVALTAENNSQLKEKTDREGFVENIYAHNFFRLMAVFANETEVLLNNLRRSYNEFRKLYVEQSPEFLAIPAGQFAPKAREITSEGGKIRSQVASFEANIDATAQNLNKIARDLQQAPLLASEEERRLASLLVAASTKIEEARSLANQMHGLLDQLKTLGPSAEAIEARLRVLEDRIEQFAELAGLGLTAEVLSHEFNTVADRMAERTKRLEAYLNRKKQADSEIISYVEYIHTAISALRKQLSHLAPSLRYVREKKDRIEILPFFEDLLEFYNPTLGRSGINVKLVQPFQNFDIVMNKGKLTQVVDILVLNSEYWLREAVKRHDVENPTIYIEAIAPYIRISDNGLGVEPSIEASLFQPFVTTKPKNVGRGLGLFISRELLDSSGCSITLLPDRNSNGRRYIFQIDLMGALDE